MRGVEDAGEGFSYPQDLHSNGNSNRDSNVIKPVKTKVAETFAEFISKGTYGGKELYNKKRNGKYHLFVMLKSDESLYFVLKEIYYYDFLQCKNIKQRFMDALDVIDSMIAFLHMI